MIAGSLRALEFDRVVEALCSFALTPPGLTRLAVLRPQADPQQVERSLALTTEAVRYLQEQPLFPLRAPTDLGALLAALAIEGRALEPLRLLGLSDYLESIAETHRAIRRTVGPFPALEALTEGAASFAEEIGAVRSTIDAAGEVVDHASPALRALRERLHKQRTRLRRTLESYLRGKETSRYLQEQVVTERNGRYVLVVRAEHRATIPGIIHGRSGSGASLFLEPLSTVDVNNEIVALEEQEAEEVHRILLDRTDAFRKRATELQRTLEVGTELDVMQAKARLAHAMDASAPMMAADGRLELRAARHPLLIPAVTARLRDGAPAEAASHSSEPVSVDIMLIPPTTVLIVTGPNTGGKTVALKTAGLLSLMAQAGLHLPAAPGSRVPVFQSVFADIGDEQSIAANLSTFSWHVTNIAAMDRALARPALVLLDEIGVGTDPVEGGALGMAIIDHFRRRGALVLASTHADALKTYASTTEGVASAAFGFDPDTFAPTFRLIYGAPGRSLALEIAGRLGLAPSILETARANLSAHEARLAEHLAKIDESLRALDHERRLVAREREMLGAAELRIRTHEEEIHLREERAKRRLDEQLDERIREARREVDAIVDDLKRKTAALAADAARRAREVAPALSTGEAGAARADARTALDAITDRFRHPVDTPRLMADGSATPSVGDRVAIGGLGVEGTVLLVHDREAEIDVRGKRLRARLDELQVLAGGPAPARVSVSVHVLAREVASDLNVIGCSVDEAVARAEKFLDGMLLGDQHTVRVIHGHGSGRLRRAIAEFLERHPLVAKFESAPHNQGGGGVTVVELKE